MAALRSTHQDHPGLLLSSRLLVTLVVPGALLLLAAAVQAVWFRPPRSINYFELAARFPDVDPDHHSLRIGLLLPVRAAQVVFGYSQVAYYAVPLLASAVLVLGTYWLGRELFSAAVGAAASVLVVFSHIFLSGASILLPDILGTALFTCAIALLVAVARRTGAGHPQWRRHQNVRLVVVGFLLGWSYLVREYMVFVFPVIPVVFWAYRMSWRRILPVAGTAAAVLGFELVLNAILYGSPFERITVASSHGGARDYITDSRIDALVRLPVRLAEAPGAIPALTLLALGAVAIMLRGHAFRVLAAWLVSFWLLITLGTGLIDPSFRFVIADMLRYWTPLLPALALAGAAVVYEALALVWRWWAAPSGGPQTVVWAPGVVVVVLALVLGIAGSVDARASHVYTTNGATQLDKLRTWLSRHRDEGPIWTDPFTARVLPLYERSPFGTRLWSGTVRDFERNGRFIDLHDVDQGVIVLYGPGYRRFTRRLSDGRFAVPGARAAIRQFERDPGPGAEIVLRARDLTVYRITN